jgi:hypothetical protein
VKPHVGKCPLRLEFHREKMSPETKVYLKERLREKFHLGEKFYPREKFHPR